MTPIMHLAQPSASELSELEGTVQEAVAAAQAAAQAAVDQAVTEAADARALAQDAREQARDARAARRAEDQNFNVRIGDGGLIIERTDQAGNTVAQPFDASTLIPPQATDLLLISVIGVVAMILAFPIGRAIARYIDRRGTSAPIPNDVGKRLVAIEQAVDAVAIEMERMSEANRFTTRLLTERVGTPDFAASVERADVAQPVAPRG